jgi:hypothetical protein
MKQSVSTQSVHILCFLMGLKELLEVTDSNTCLKAATLNPASADGGGRASWSAGALEVVE